MSAQIDTCSALDDLEEIAAQNSIRQNSKTTKRRGWSIAPNIEHGSPARAKPERGHRPGKGYRFNISPNLEKARVSREPKPTSPKSATAAAKTKPSPIAAPPTAVARMIETYTQFVDALRDRSNELGMTREELDFQAGHQNGYSGKLLSRKHIKRFGFCSLGPSLGALGLKILLIEDTAQTAAIKARMTPRQRPVRATVPLADNETTERAAPCP